MSRRHDDTVPQSPWLGDVPFFTFPDLSLPTILLLATGAKVTLVTLGYKYEAYLHNPLSSKTKRM